MKRHGKPLVEPLEPRTFLSVGHVCLCGGILRVYGTAGNDTITASQAAFTVNVKINGKSWTFPTSKIKGIVVSAGQGNDMVNLGGAAADAVRIPAILHGDAGSDTLTGGAATDTLFGDAGNDTLIASPGHDKAYGGTGFDTAVIIGPGTPPPPNVPPPPSYNFSFIARDVERIVLPA